MSIKVVPKFLLRNYIGEEDWEEARDNIEEEALTLKEYTEQVEIPDDTQNALINKVKDLFSQLLSWEHEGETNVDYDIDSGIYKLIRPGTSEAEFRQLIIVFNDVDDGILNDANARFGTGYIYLDTVPNSYSANINNQGGKRKNIKKRSVRRKSKQRKHKKRHTKRKY